MDSKGEGSESKLGKGSSLETFKRLEQSVKKSQKARKQRMKSSAKKTKPKSSQKKFSAKKFFSNQPHINIDRFEAMEKNNDDRINIMD